MAGRYVIVSEFISWLPKLGVDMQNVFTQIELGIDLAKSQNSAYWSGNYDSLQAVVIRLDQRLDTIRCLLGLGRPAGDSAAVDEAIQRFEEAVEEHSWLGARMPDEHEEIREEYRRAKAHLRNVILKGGGATK